MKVKNYQSITYGLVLSSLSVLTFSANAADGVEFKFSGQISRAITHADNGVDYLSITTIVAQDYA